MLLSRWRQGRSWIAGSLAAGGVCVLVLIALLTVQAKGAGRTSARTASGGTFDFGHAPDGRPTGYLAGASLGEFPSTAAHGGPQHTSVGKLFLGPAQDGEPRAILRKVDPDDDGAMALLHACKTSTLLVMINPKGLPAAQRSLGHTIYVNAWFDWNRNGRWDDASDGCAREWAIENLPISAKLLAAGKPIVVPISFTAGRQVEELWYRVQLTLDEPATDPGGHGGFRPFTVGETEDYLIQGRPLRLALPKKKIKIRLKRPIFEEESEEEEPPEEKPGEKEKKEKEEKEKKGKFRVSCAPNPSIIPHGSRIKVKFLVADKGSGLIFGGLLGSSGPGGGKFGLTPVTPQPAGVPPGWLMVDGFTFKSTMVDPPFRVVPYSYKFTFRRGKQQQKLTCHVFVVHFKQRVKQPRIGPPFRFPPICPLAGITPLGPLAGLCTLPPPCPRVCGTPSSPLAPVPGVKGGWEQKPSSIPGSFFDVSVELQLPPGVDMVKFPLRGQATPWPWAELDRLGGGLPGGLRMPPCALGAPQGGPPALECPVQSPGGSFFDIFTDINLAASNGGVAPSVTGELWSSGRAIGSFSVPFVAPACPAGYTGTPPSCVKFEGTGLFHATAGPSEQYQLQFNQATTAYEIQLLGGQIVAAEPQCSKQTVKNPNDAIVCSANTPANTAIKGQFATFPAPEKGTKFEIYGLQGETKFGGFGPFEGT
jgi:hypothetical protein